MTFQSVEEAALVREGHGMRWVANFAALIGESQEPPPVPNAASVTVEIPGLTLFPDFINADEAQMLLSNIDSGSWDTSIKRRVQHYGHAFDYSTIAMADYVPPPLPDFVLPLVERPSRGGITDLRGDHKLDLG